jgi:hypothetical protein
MSTAKLVRILALACALSRPAGFAPASADDTLAGACAAEVAAHCKSVKPGNGRLIACLVGDIDKLRDFTLSPGCRTAVEATKARLRTATDACYDDAVKNCATVQPGGGRILNCLRGVRLLGTDCKTQIDKLNYE